MTTEQPLALTEAHTDSMLQRVEQQEAAWLQTGSGPRPGVRAVRLLAQFKRPSVALPGVLLLVIVLACAVVPIFGVLPDPNTGLFTQANLPIGTHGHLLGTNQFGNDELSRLLYGGRVSLVVGAVSTLIGGAIGLILGVVAGYFGRWTDVVVSRILDVFLAFPALILALAIAAYLGPSEIHTIYAISVFAIAGFGRLARAEVLRLRDSEYIVAARVNGRNPVQIILGHVLPNIAPAMLTFALVSFGIAIVAEAALSYLGLSVQSPTASWGNMIAAGQSFLSQTPALVLLPSAMLFLTVLSINLLSDGLRDGVGRRAEA
jgi:peptide/nickel transport system permease protein